MQLRNIKLILIGAWLVAIVAVGIVGGVVSPGARAVLAAFAILPPIALMRFWTSPVPTLSESIDQARR